MKLFRKIDNAHKKILSKLKLLKIKLINNRNIKIGISSSFKKNSRLKVFGNNGKIHIGKFFSNNQGNKNPKSKAVVIPKINPKFLNSPELGE